MKKLTLIAAITINYFLLTINLFSQPCLPEGITFTTQAEIDSFQINYPGCTEIEGDVVIESWTDISNLNGLIILTSIGGNLDITSTSNLAELTGLDNVTSIGGNLEIYYNDSLSSLSGLEGLTSIEGSLSIGKTFLSLQLGNPILTTLSGLQNLTSLGGGLGIVYNDALTNLSGLENLTAIEGLGILGNDALTNLSGLENITSIGGNVNIGWRHSGPCGNLSLTSFAAMNNLNFVGGDFMIFGNPLTSLIGLDNLYTIGGSLTIDSDSITSLTGLGNLNTIEGSLNIGYEFGLGNSSLLTLDGLDNLTTIGEDLRIQKNSVLSSITSLESVTSIEGKLEIFNNNTLTSLIGLDNIEPASISDLKIINNSSLYDCDIWPICQYLADTSTTAEIHNNATECNSVEEVLEHCLTEIVEYVSADKLNIYPNPLGSNTLITYTLENNSSVTLKILDLSGREIVTLVNEYQQQGEQRVVFTTEGLKPGVYFCTLKTNEGIQTKKIIKL